MSSFIKTDLSEDNDLKKHLRKFSKQYKNYKSTYNFPEELSKLNTEELIITIIKFDTATFDRITKDKSSKFVDQLSAIGGTMGLLTGFSLISAVEIIYFSCIILFGFIKNFKRKMK